MPIAAIGIQLKISDERARIKQIEDEEWHHRKLVGEMLLSLGSQPSRQREVRSLIIGRVLGVLCHVMGWLAPMYGAGRLESRNIREYETAARYARACGRNEFVDCLLTMAEVEWEHEYYFRSRVLLHSVGRTSESVAAASAEGNYSCFVCREGDRTTSERRRYGNCYRVGLTLLLGARASRPQ